MSFSIRFMIRDLFESLKFSGDVYNLPVSPKVFTFRVFHLRVFHCGDIHLLLTYDQ